MSQRSIELIKKHYTLAKLTYSHANIAEVESRRAELEKAAAAELTAAKARGELLSGMDLVIPANVGTEGKLIGSVGPIDVADAFEKVGVEVARAEVRMPDGPIHEVGEFVIGLHLHSDVNVDVNLKVVPEE